MCKLYKHCPWYTFIIPQLFTPFLPSLSLWPIYCLKRESNGELLLSLTYKPCSGMLHGIVLKANNLRRKNITGTAGWLYMVTLSQEAHALAILLKLKILSPPFTTIQSSGLYRFCMYIYWKSWKAFNSTQWIRYTLISCTTSVKYHRFGMFRPEKFWSIIIIVTYTTCSSINFISKNFTCLILLL